MRFLFRWAFRLLILLLVVAIGLFLTKDALAKWWIVSEFREQGMDAKIGQLDIGFPLNSTVAASDIRIFNLPEYGGSQMLHIDDLFIDCDFSDLMNVLWKLKPHFRQVRIGITEFNLVETKGGERNLLSLPDAVAKSSAHLALDESPLYFTIGNLIEFNNIEDVLTLGSPIGSNDLVTAVGGNATTANPDFSASFYLGPSNASEDFDTTRSAEGQELGNTTTQVDGRFDDGALDLGYHEPFGKGATLPTDANPDMTVLACDQFGDAQRDVVFRPSAFEAETGSGHAFTVDVDAAFNVTVAGRTNLDPVGSGNSTYVIDRGDGSYSFRVFTQVLSGSFTVDLSFGVGQEPVESFNISYDYNSCGQQS